MNIVLSKILEWSRRVQLTKYLKSHSQDDQKVIKHQAASEFTGLIDAICYLLMKLRKATERKLKVDEDRLEIKKDKIERQQKIIKKVWFVYHVEPKKTHGLKNLFTASSFVIYITVMQTSTTPFIYLLKWKQMIKSTTSFIIAFLMWSLS